MKNYMSLVDLITDRKNEELKGITFIHSDDKEEFISYKSLFDVSSRALYNLQRAGFKKGDEVVFQLDNNQQFIYAFWACVLGGMIPVPITTGANEEHKHKLFRVWSILNNPKMITTIELAEKLKTFAGEKDTSLEMDKILQKAICIENILFSETQGVIYYPDFNDIAFIQFSSGSTGDPKGVIITHKNILVNLSSVLDWAEIGSNDSSLNWVPLTHDLGLIGAHIKSILANINQFNIQTAIFVMNPILWLQKVSEHKVTILYSPNFGYKHLLETYKKKSKKRLGII